MKLIRIIISITLPFFLLIFFASLLTTTPYLMASKGLYASHEDVYFDHANAVDKIIGYLNYRYDDLQVGMDENDTTQLITEDEVSHMVDVKNLYTGLRVAALASLVVAVSLSILLFKHNRKELYLTYKNIYIGPIFFIMFVGGYIIIDFNAAFTAFHNIFFTSGTWTFSYYSVLILLLPINFWMVSGVLILVFFSLSLGLIYYLNEKINKKHFLN
ncbi:MAG: TIGR01906 family membrane protein [Bacilli bacterium]|nr:TIGR01906 family membrane protein [Bacilli bacterium]